jgi:hypothetical protein
VAAKLKRQGAKAGVPDIMILEPTEYGFGLAIELKSAKGRVRKEQTKWLTDLADRGWCTAICRDLQSVRNACAMVRPLHGRAAPY